MPSTSPRVAILACRLVAVGALLSAFAAVAPKPASASAVYQALPFSQNWSSASLITTNDDWSTCPGFIGYRGDALAVGAGADPRTILGDDVPGVVDVNANQTDPLLFVTGGVTEFQLVDPAVALVGSGTAKAPYLVLHLNTTGKSFIRVTYTLRDLEGAGGTDNAVQQVALQFRTAAAGVWTNVAGAYVSDATSGPGTTLSTPINVMLPNAANDKATLQIRWMTTDAVGSDEAVGIDDIVVTASQFFVEATSGPLADAAGHGAGVAWADLDADDDLDLFVVNNGQADRYFRNTAGVWTDATSGVLVDNSFGYGVSGADYDNDGDIDLFLHSGLGPLLARNDAGTWVSGATGSLVIPRNGRGIVWGDFDKDGDVDLFLSNDNDSCKLFRNDAGTFVDASNGQFGGVDNWQGAAAGDYDDDGDLDLYVVNASNGNRLYRNNGGTWSNVTSGPLSSPTNGRGVAWGDYDNDGDLDLFVASFGFDNRLFRNDGAGVWVDATNVVFGSSVGSEGPAWGDYDNDGDLDVYLANLDAPSKLFRNDDGAWTDVSVSPLDIAVGSVGSAWGDYDRDGDLDLFVTNTGAANHLLRNDNGLGNHWFHLNLVGTVSNRSAIGARVRVLAGGWSRIAEISGGSGYCSQNSLEAEFGLGSAAVIESLTVRWPSGIVWDSTNVAVDQRLTVIERGSITGVEASAPGAALELSSASPNPFQDHTRFDYALPASGRVSLVVLDLQGRAVATLASGEHAAGRHSASWDGRDTAGRTVRAGVYFARLQAGNGAAVLRRVAVTP